jgi:hypothetical protein
LGRRCGADQSFAASARPGGNARRDDRSRRPFAAARVPVDASAHSAADASPFTPTASKSAVASTIRGARTRGAELPGRAACAEREPRAGALANFRFPEAAGPPSYLSSLSL